MSRYDRTTRNCLVSELPTELLQAVRDYSQEQQLGDVEAETLFCCETLSTKKSAGRLPSWLEDDLDATLHTALLLTPQWLIWARQGDRTKPVVMAANLKDIQVKAYTSRFTKDTGLEIVGYIGVARRRARGYVGLGADAAAQEFCEAVKAAISKVNPPAQRRPLKWWGG
ncbi:MAG TPA: hypothetical protein PKH77_01000 [Anaerolineae bacterium]|nr:hypothetical protein [Anaerolineae bacterium]